jgi:hypothetical protein
MQPTSGRRFLGNPLPGVRRSPIRVMRRVG